VGVAAAVMAQQVWLSRGSGWLVVGWWLAANETFDVVRNLPESCL